MSPDVFEISFISLPEFPLGLGMLLADPLQTNLTWKNGWIRQNQRIFTSSGALVNAIFFWPSAWNFQPQFPSVPDFVALARLYIVSKKLFP